MKIRTKLILNYSLLSIILLLIFSVIVVFLYTKYRQYNFGNRLYNRAASSANLLLNESIIDSSMLKLIDKNLVTGMDDLQISIYDQNKKVLYSNQITKISKKSTNNSFAWIFSGYKKISFTHNKNGLKHLIEASAIDSYGLMELKSLLYIITFVLIFSIIIIAGFGFYNAVWSLKPFKEIIKEVEQINPTNINKRVSVTGK